MWLFVGLGNPGPKYSGNRHNVGFLCLEAFARKHSQSISKSEHKAITGRVRLGPDEILLALPQTYMNLSGESVGALMTFYKIPPEHLLVVHDEVDQPPMKLKFQRDRGPGGHNGLKSINQVLGTQAYGRLRIGVGRPLVPGMEVADYVLQNFSSEEQKRLEKLFDRTNAALESYVTQGFEKTSSLYNRNEPEI